MIYFVCYDSKSEGFRIADEYHCYAYDKNELQKIIYEIIMKHEVDPKNVCIFKLLEEKVKITREKNEVLGIEITIDGEKIYAEWQI